MRYFQGIENSLRWCRGILSDHARVRVFHVINQGSQTRGPRAACGPTDAFVRPANTSKKYQEYNIWSNLAIFEGFSCILRPAENFISRMWPSNQFEFETLVLNNTNIKRSNYSQSWANDLLLPNCNHLSITTTILRSHWELLLHNWPLNSDHLSTTAWVPST